MPRHQERFYLDYSLQNKKLEGGARQVNEWSKKKQALERRDVKVGRRVAGEHKPIDSKREAKGGKSRVTESMNRGILFAAVPGF